MNICSTDIRDGVSIILPMYNERKKIATVLEELFMVLNRLGMESEVIVVNDGSTDGCEEIAGIYPVKLIHHETNRGYGRALKSGIIRSRYNRLIWFDSDGQHKAETVKRFVVELEDADVVIGVRKISDSISMTRYVGKFFIWNIGRLMLGTKMYDLNCGLRAFKRSVLIKYLHLIPDGYSASMTTSIIFSIRNYKLKTMHININLTDPSSHFQVLKDGLRAFNQLVRMAMLFRPWRLFGSIGITLFSFGLLFGLRGLLSNAEFPSNASLSMVTGIFSVFFGLIMDQISEIRKSRFEDLDLFE